MTDGIKEIVDRIHTAFRRTITNYVMVPTVDAKALLAELTRLQLENADLKRLNARCEYVVSWAGRCKESPIEGSDMCRDHHGKKCDECEKPAVTSCYHTNGPFVCGRKMCVDHCQRKKDGTPSDASACKSCDDGMKIRVKILA